MKERDLSFWGSLVDLLASLGKRAGRKGAMRVAERRPPQVGRRLLPVVLGLGLALLVVAVLVYVGSGLLVMAHGGASALDWRLGVLGLLMGLAMGLLARRQSRPGA